MKGWKGLLWMAVPFVVSGGLLAVILLIQPPGIIQFGGPVHYLRMFFGDPHFAKALWNTFGVSLLLSVVLLVGFCALRAFLRRKSLHLRFNKLFFGAAFAGFTGGVYLLCAPVSVALFGYSSANYVVDALISSTLEKPAVIQLPLLLGSVMISSFFCFILWLIDRLLLRKITPSAALQSMPKGSSDSGKTQGAETE